MHMSRIAPLVFCLIFQSFSTFASDQEDEKSKAIDTLMEILDARQITTYIAQIFTSQLMKRLEEKSGKLDRAVAEIVYSESQVIMYENFIANGKIREIVHKAYGEHYTTEELKALVAFYQSSLGKKMLSTGEQVTISTMQQAKDHAVTFAPQAQERVLNKLRLASERAAAFRAQQKDATKTMPNAAEE